MYYSPPSWCIPVWQVPKGFLPRERERGGLLLTDYYRRSPPVSLSLSLSEENLFGSCHTDIHQVKGKRGVRRADERRGQLLHTSAYGEIQSHTCG